MIKRSILLTSCSPAIIICCLFLNACTFNEKEGGHADITVDDSTRYTDTVANLIDTIVADSSKINVQPIPFDNPQNRIDVKNVQPQQLVAFAKTLTGVPYKYASMDPSQGFDCSGFISYVFNHFSIAVPRSSVDFTNIPVQVTEQQAKPGDLILFTGTDSTIRVVGHMGIVIEKDSAGLRFIHSSSGKANGVTVSPLEGYYRGRFVKLIRIF